MPSIQIIASAALAALPALPAALAQSSCPSTCAGTTEDGTAFDLSALMGADYQTTGADSASDTYFLNVCGTSATQCPDDAGDPPVTQGTAVQTQDGGGCYVLGAYTGDNCLWTSNPGGQEGIELVLDNGSDNLCADGSPRQVTIDFLCPDAGSSGPLVPAAWTAVNLPQSCEYTYTFETCAACAAGCSSDPGPSPPPPPNTPSGSNPGTDSPWAIGFLIVTFAAVMPLYIAGAALYNYKVKGARGADIMQLTPTFWGSLFTNVKAGVSFTLSGFKSDSVSSGSVEKYDGMGPGQTSDVSYQKADGVGSDSYQTGSQP